MQTVAILYCDPHGPYPSLSVPGIWLECWGLPHRDAKRYDGPWPVVAHPPCGAWGRLRTFHRKQDKNCAPRAVDQVRQCGGVLEHPSGSLLWCEMGLPKPGERCDEFGGRTFDVYQSDWGHLALKRTWLYCVAVGDEQLEFPAPRRVAKKTIPDCTGAQRRRTPPDFARYLVKLAASVTRPRSTGGAS